MKNIFRFVANDDKTREFWIGQRQYFRRVAQGEICRMISSDEDVVFMESVVDKGNFMAIFDEIAPVIPMFAEGDAVVSPYRRVATVIKATFDYSKNRYNHLCRQSDGYEFECCEDLLKEA